MMVLVKLMKRDYTFPIIYCMPTTTISFYETVGSNLDQAMSDICSKFREILCNNPWLCGRIVKETVQGESGVYLSYEQVLPTDLDQYLVVRTEDKVFQFKEWVPLCDYLGPLQPKMGVQCIGKNERLCQLVVFRGIEVNKIAIMWSLCHSLGDGWTFYRLWKMLDKSEAVTQLVFERIHEADDLVERDTNLEPDEDEMQTLCGL